MSSLFRRGGDRCSQLAFEIRGASGRSGFGLFKARGKLLGLGTLARERLRVFLLLVSPGLLKRAQKKAAKENDKK